MGIKQEITMVKRNDGKKTACVNDIVTGVEMCKIDDNGPKDKDLSDMLRNMKLGESKAKKKFGQQQPQHEDDDEREDNGPRSDQTVGSDNLIKLEAPSSDDKEHDEDELQIKHEEGDAVLGERGPILGVPVNYNMEQGHNYIANKSCKPYQIQTNYSTGNSIQPALPANFPDYSYNASRTAQVKGSKREIDERERYSEPPKWIRPQNAGMMEVNNLSAPWSVPNSNAANTNGKTVSQVYRKQMSGGTVYTPEGAPYPVEQFFNSHDNRDQLEFQDLFELGLDESAFNIAVDADDFLQTSGPPSLQLTGTVDQKNGQINNAPNKMSVSHQQWHNSQSSLPPVNQRTNSYPNHFQQQQFENYHQQTLRQYHEVQRGKRSSIGNDDYSDGYGSDLSPSHGVQSPPEQSPRSIMDASPGTYSGSPPQTNWSPPPSNMSDCSVDSGVCSPMTEDQNGYTSMKSPRQGYMMSPQSIASLPGTPQSRAMSTSPPHHYMSPTLTNSPSYQTVSHEQKVLQNDVYVSSFVDDHLTDLDCALEIASEDLMAERLRKGYQVSSVQSNGTNNNISHVNGVINNINVCLHNGTVNAPPRSFAMAVAPPNGTKLQDVVSTKPVTNSVMKEKSHGIPNLPMTVPTTVTLSNKNMIIYQQITNVNSPSNNRMNAITNNINTVQSSIPGPFYLTSATTNTSHPPINNHGKIAIAPLNPKPTPQVQSQMVPVFVTRGGTMANTVIIMPNGPPNTPTRKLPVLIPKEPVKPKESVPEVSVKPSNVGTTSTSASSAVQGEQSTNVSTPDGKIPVASSDVKLLNLARRLVAEMETSDLKYQDEDGDTYVTVFFFSFHLPFCH
uniref:Uncharacterized protein n=1 Tax=Arion vulgaris TaxID=1028688 RepID=A0A0B7B6M8_9EUPU